MSSKLDGLIGKNIYFCQIQVVNYFTHRIRMYAMIMVCHLPSIYPKCYSIWIPYMHPMGMDIYIYIWIYMVGSSNQSVPDIWRLAEMAGW